MNLNTGNENTIITNYSLFNIEKLNLFKPIKISTNAYFIPLKYNYAPLYIETPKCKTKNGIVGQKKTNAKFYTELMLDNSEDVVFINMFEKLEDKCKSLLCDNSSTWFGEEYDLNTLDSMYIESLKTSKSGKYTTMKANLVNNMNLYDEDFNTTDYSTIKADKDMIVSIIDIKGIEIKGESHFELRIEMKQALIKANNVFMEKCLIGRNKDVEVAKDVEVKKDVEVDKDIEVDKDVEVDKDKDIEVEIDDIEIDDVDNEEIKINNVDIENINIDDLVDDIDESGYVKNAFKLKTKEEVYMETYRKAKEELNKINKEAVEAMKIAKELKNHTLEQYYKYKSIKNLYTIHDDSDIEIEFEE